MKESTIGKVFLMGAGPGDPGLVTVIGLERIREADAILYDNQANRPLLDFAKPGAEVLFVGKEPGVPSIAQDKIAEILIEKARKGLTVVRLKGGDPLIFGRGSEEAMALKKAGVSFEIIPGVTAGIAAAAYSGIPLTHRSTITQCVFISGYETADKDESLVDWAKIATLKNASLVVYMGVAQIGAVAAVLLRKGMNPDTETAVIENASLPNQKTHYCKLSELSDKIYDFNVKPPVIFIIGPTVQLREEMVWIANKPLYGKRIVITRTRDQAADSFNRLKILGACPIQFPVVKTERMRLHKPIREIMQRSYDWIVFTNENSVRYFFEVLKDERSDSRVLGGLRIAAVGNGTVSALESCNILPDFVPSGFGADLLIDEMHKKKHIKDSRLLLVKGDQENSSVSERIAQYGGKADTLDIYKVSPDTPGIDAINDVRNFSAHAYLFTSMATVNHFFRIVGESAAKEMLNKSVVIAIGPVTATALREKEVGGIIIAEKNTIEGMIEELLKAF